MNNKTTAIFGDLTALFNARSRFRKTINYKLLDEVLRKNSDIEKWDVNRWYTIFSDNNKAQASFIEGLKSLGWDVETLKSKNVHKFNKHSDYRFDSRICYQLGTCSGEIDNIVVVSDSFDLYYSIKDLKEDDCDINVSLAFFGDALDGRWWKVLNKEDSVVNFVDLDDLLYRS